MSYELGSRMIAEGTLTRQAPTKETHAIYIYTYIYILYVHTYAIYVMYLPLTCCQRGAKI